MQESGLSEPRLWCAPQLSGPAPCAFPSASWGCRWRGGGCGCGGCCLDDWHPVPLWLPAGLTTGAAVIRWLDGCHGFGCPVWQAMGLGPRAKEPSCQCRRCKRRGFHPWAGESPGGGHGPLQHSRLENPMAGGAWRAMVLRVTKSRTRPKCLSTHTWQTMCFCTDAPYTILHTSSWRMTPRHTPLPWPLALRNKYILLSPPLSNLYTQGGSQTPLSPFAF